HGPEGGGASSYIIVDLEKGESVSVLLSSNFSPGDGSTPEAVSARECKNAIGRGNKTLSKLRFVSRFEDGFLTCPTDRLNLFSNKDSKAQALAKDKLSAVISKLAIENQKRSLVIYLTKDGSEGLVLIDNSSCDAKCLRLKTDNGLKVAGDCSK
ncbi:MAG: hypothetical protein K2Q18_14635, partial [Bdellovibrionales bacterium]|nr:hypothetical protein [Bdellovibrionales bacterium]